MDFPDSHLSEFGRKEKYAMIQRLSSLANLIKKEKEYYYENPIRDVRTALQSIKYHTDQINTFSDILLQRVQRAIDIEVEDYNRKVKQALLTRQQAIQRYENSINHKSKAQCGYEADFKQLSEKYQKMYGSVPVKIQDDGNPKANLQHPEPNIIEPLDYVKRNLFIPETSTPTKEIVLTSLIETPLTQIPETFQQSLPEPPRPPTPPPTKPEPPAEPVKVEVFQNIPRSFMYTDDPDNPFIPLDELEVIEARYKSKGLPLPFKLYDTKPDLSNKVVNKTVEVPPPAIPKPKKPLKRGSNAKGAGVNLYEVPSDD